MKVTFVSEGTYPFAMGGVSVWMDQLIRGMPDHRWEVYALTVDGAERSVWELPDNLGRVVSVPLWKKGPRRSSRTPGPAFGEIYGRFLEMVLTPAVMGEGSEEFLLVLESLYRFAHDGGDLVGALTANDSLTQLMDAWYWNRTDGLTLADAINAGDLMGHMLRPLAEPPPRADLVHVTMNGLSSLPAMTAKWQYGTPIVLSEHGVYLRERYLQYVDEPVSHAVRVLLLSFFRRLVAAAYVAADRIAPHSSYNRRWQVRNGADPDRIRIMYNGVDPDDFPRAESEPAEPTLVFMGRVDPLKDLHTLIRAFAIVRDKIPDARLRMFGGVPAGNETYHQSCLDLIGELGLEGAATFEGRVSTPVHAYHAGHVIALTSISEGFPYTVVEAMACGRPVVCTNVGGVAEAVDEAGLVVPPRDHVAAADAAVRLLRDAGLRRRLSALARDRVLERFTLRQSLDDYRSVYAELVEAPP
ncbi:Glycosyltransferase involved in cell wall bisynthesis [Nonomuraea solani]|uniref:Glycosyltransferase involved in cell wall bisynthesis n=1 Tax=Nonomuraea solani TaxID=1144553 RepID=A0A1H6CLD8_9ACTN|nr:GT4 family glycosyltransferase PelF [Nonomuraea solani]SEG73475.1 Glycosyltransferase involved in cell wall bisynthesis [Nonomuraea solani]